MQNVSTPPLAFPPSFLFPRCQSLQPSLFEVVPNGGKGDCGPSALWQLLYGGYPRVRDLKEIRQQAIDEVQRELMANEQYSKQELLITLNLVQTDVFFSA